MTKALCRWKIWEGGGGGGSGVSGAQRNRLSGFWAMSRFFWGSKHPGKEQSRAHRNTLGRSGQALFGLLADILYFNAVSVFVLEVDDLSSWCSNAGLTIMPPRCL